MFKLLYAKVCMLQANCAQILENKLYNRGAAIRSKVFRMAEAERDRGSAMIAEAACIDSERDALIKHAQDAIDRDIAKRKHAVQVRANAAIKLGQSILQTRLSF